MSAKIAFYAPLKSPNHPIPSGDREIARLMIKALSQAGFDVDLISETISYQKRPSEDLYNKRREAVREEEQRLFDEWSADPGRRPDLWFTYHPYCKSPDWLGPPLCERFDIPYVTAEACKTNQNTDKDWERGRSSAQAAIRLAAVNFVLKDSDWNYLETVLTNMQTAYRIPPFLSMEDQPKRDQSASPTVADRDPRLFTVGMMRPGAKSQSYDLLASALRTVKDKDWSLTVAGEGPERERIEAEFGFVDAERLRFLGSVAHEEIFAIMDQSDIFVWPGIGEAIGLVYLEAQSRGLPVVAMETAGVPLVVSNGIGGLLTPDGDANAYGAAIGQLLDKPVLRQSLSAEGTGYVRQNHDVQTVANIFRDELSALIQR